MKLSAKGTADREFCCQSCCPESKQKCFSADRYEYRPPQFFKQTNNNKLLHYLKSEIDNDLPSQQSIIRLAGLSFDFC